jgi:WD40 repeat protein/serine/threonine protein kinase
MNHPGKYPVADEKKKRKYSDMWLLSPETLVDHFRIIRPLGKGGMAEVYLARDTKLGRKVALKVVRPETLGSKEAIERFLFEARATARFSHPHIVTIFAVGESDGRPYVALEYLEGQSLRQRMEQQRPSLAETVRIGMAIAEALKEAHGGDILHRDLKPENVILSIDGRLRVLDFGLAGVRQREEDPDQRQDLLESAILEPAGSRIQGVQGTPAYMAPEQWEEKESTGAVDVWALGVILYELVSGRRPYEETSAVKQAARVLGPYPVPALEGEAPSELEALIMDCLNKDPAKRPSSSHVVRHLSEFISRDREMVPTEESPYRGLLAFDERHRHFFFGRDSEIAAFVERLRQQPVLPVVGPSGAGKSSFVQAGVIPRLRERGPLVVLHLRPGSDPFLVLANRIVSARRQTTARKEPAESTLLKGKNENLDDTLDQALETEADRLARQLQATPHLLNLVLHRLADRRNSQVVLFVDQLEELYALVTDVTTRRAFMQAICTAADDPGMPVRVIFTVREEFLSRLAEGAGVREVLSQITVLRSPDPDSLQEILLRPLQTVGYSFDDPKMVWEMVADVEGEVSPLPLLQFAGRMLWDRRDKAGRVLKRSVYEAMGGVAGALAQHADGVLAGLSSQEVRLARGILLRLVTGEGTRQALTRSKLLEGLDRRADDVLKRLTLARLVTIRQSEIEGEGELELVHESLIATWGRLARWIDESREELVFLAEVSQAANLWEKRGERAEEVWQGDALREAKRAVEHCTSDIPSQVRRFLEAGLRKEKRHTWRTRGGVVAAFLGLVVLALVFIAKEHETRSQKEVAEHERAVAQREGAAATMIQGNVLEARAKLRASLEVEDSVSSRALWSRLLEDPLVWRRDVPEIVSWLSLSPDGKTAAASMFGGWVVLIDVATAESHRFRAYREGYVTTVFSPDNKYLAYFTEIGQVCIWDLDSRAKRVLGQHGERIHAADLSQDGKLIATAGDDGTVRLWDTETGSERQIGPTADKPIWSVSIGPKSKQLATVGEDKSIRIWNIANGDLVRTLGGKDEWVKWAKFGEKDGVLVSIGKEGVRSWNLSSDTNILIPERTWMAFSKDLKWLATREEDGAIHLWDVFKGKDVKVLADSNEKVGSRSFSSDGSLFLGVDTNNVIRVWDTKTGEPKAVLSGHSAMVPSAVIGPNNRHLVSGGFDKSIRYWDLTRTLRQRENRGPTDQVIGVDFSPDGSRLATSGFDRLVRIWDTHTGKELARLEGHTTTVWRLAYSPTGKQVATASHDNTVRLWDVDTFSPEKHKVLEGHTRPVQAVDFSPDGKLVASCGLDGTIRIWDTATGAQKRMIKVEATSCDGESKKESAVISLVFGPEGRRLVSSSADETIRVWDVNTGKQLDQFEVKPYANALALSPDGGLLAYGGNDGKLFVREMASGKVREVGKHWGWIYELVFHPDGKRVATASRDDTARIWDLDTGEFVELKGHRSDVNRLSFHPDGRILATGGDDATVRLWNVNPRGSTARGGLYWRTSLLYAPESGPVEVFTHRGWAMPGKDNSEAPEERMWRKAVEVARFASADRESHTLCLCTLDGHLEIWDQVADELVWRKNVENADKVLAVRHGCAVLAKGAARLYKRSEDIVDLGVDAVALSWDEPGAELLVVAEDQVRVFDSSGRKKMSFASGRGVNALASVRDVQDPSRRWIALGTQEGNIQLLSRSPATTTKRESTPLRDTARSPVVAMVEGVPGTLVIGFASGEVGIWDMQNGSRLDHGKLHGPIFHMLMHDNRLYVASEMGDFLTWDLAAYEIPYCELLGQVWEDVLLVWKDGRAQPKSPPRDHSCSRGPYRSTQARSR